MAAKVGPFRLAWNSGSRGKSGCLHLVLTRSDLESGCFSLPGGYQNETEQSSCKFCGAGTYITGNGCSSCAPGSYAPARRSSCTPCEQGKYQDTVRQGSCKVCPTGYTTFIGSAKVTTAATLCNGERVEKCKSLREWKSTRQRVRVSPRLSTPFGPPFHFPDVTPPQISVVGGKTQYEIEVQIDFLYPEISASDSSSEATSVTRLDDFDKSKNAARHLIAVIWL